LGKEDESEVTADVAVAVMFVLLVVPVFAVVPEWMRRCWNVGVVGEWGEEEALEDES
jgi:hypothetical protein